VTEPTRKVGREKKVLQARTLLKAMVLKAVLEMLPVPDQVKVKPKPSPTRDLKQDRRLQTLDMEVHLKKHPKKDLLSHRCHTLRLN